MQRTNKRGNGRIRNFLGDLLGVLAIASISYLAWCATPTFAETVMIGSNEMGVDEHIDCDEDEPVCYIPPEAADQDIIELTPEELQLQRDVNRALFEAILANTGEEV